MRKLALLSFLLCWAISRICAQNDLREITLLFAGDVMGHTEQIKSAEVKANELYDYTPCFEYVKPIVSKADIAIANLELTLPGKPPYTGYPTFKSPDELALALRDAGFDLLVTANNHSNDAGKEGVINTLNTISRYNFLHTGTFRDAAEKEMYYPLIVYKNDFKLAFLNYTYDTNGIPTRPPTIVNLIAEKAMRADIEAAKRLEPDFIIVVMHWGLEYQLQESEEQRRLTAKLFDWGADLIIGAHPHVVQPIIEKKYFKNGKERTGLVAYSLGNYISNQNKLHTDGGIMVEVKLQKRLSANETILTDHAFYPVWRYIEKKPGGKKTYRILPASKVEKDDEKALKLPAADDAAFKKFMQNLRAHLAKSNGREG